MFKSIYALIKVRRLDRDCGWINYEMKYLKGLKVW